LNDNRDLLLVFPWQLLSLRIISGDVSFGDIVGCDLDVLRHGGMAAYSRLKEGGGMSGTLCGRQKRLRTSFKHHQLRSMKAYFALNHNPDAKDLKELAQKTGLTKRVLQVNFQTGTWKCLGSHGLQ